MNKLPSGAFLIVELTEQEARIVCNALAIAEPDDDARFMAQLDIRKKIIERRDAFAYELIRLASHC